MAFPATAVALDDFNTGALQALTARGGWGSGFLILGDVSLVTDATPSEAIATGISSNIWNTSHPAPQEAWLRFGSAVADALLYVRTDTASANISTGYRFRLTAAGVPSIQTWNAQTLVTGATQTAPSTGDTIGFACFGPLLQAFYKIGAGAWTEILRCYDTLYAGAGFIGMELATLGRVDAFGGGPMNIAQPSAPIVMVR